MDFFNREKDRSIGIPKSSKGLFGRNWSVALFAALTVLGSSLILPLLLTLSALTEAVSWFVCVFFSVTLMKLAKKLRVLIICMIAFAVSIMITGSHIIPALIFGSVISVGAGSALLSASKGSKAFLFLILPFLSFGISYLVAGNPIVSASSLIIFIPIVALWISGKANMHRTTSIALCGGVMALTALFLAGDFVFSAYGALNPQTVKQAVADISLSAVLLVEYSLNTFGEFEVSESMLREVLVAVETFINILPGLISAACLILAFFAQTIRNNAFDALGCKGYVKKDSEKITASVVSSAVFLLAHLLSFVSGASSSTSFVATVAMNLYIMLAPLFIYLGINTALALPKKRILSGTLFLIAIIIVAFVIPSSFVTVIALTGAFAVIITEIDIWAKGHYGKGENNE